MSLNTGTRGSSVIRRAGVVGGGRDHRWFQPHRGNQEGGRGPPLPLSFLALPSPHLPLLPSTPWNVIPATEFIHFCRSPGSHNVRQVAPTSVLSWTFLARGSHRQLTIQDSSLKEISEMQLLDVQPLEYTKGVCVCIYMAGTLAEY